MEIGAKPIPISVLTAVTNSALNAASVFPSRRIEISDSHTDLNRSTDINSQVIDAALQDFGVSAVRACHLRRRRLVGGLRYFPATYWPRAVRGLLVRVRLYKSADCVNHLT